MRTSFVIRAMVAGAGMVLLLAGCAQQAALDKLLVVGSDMGSKDENVLVKQGGKPVTTATVTVNGTQLAMTNASQGLYQGALPSPQPAGSTLDLVVTDGGQRVEALGKVPETPVITAPATGATVDATQPLPVTWTSTSSPDAFEVLVYQGSGSAVYDASMGGSYRTTTIPANSLNSGNSNGNLFVFAYNHGRDQVTGDAAAGSAMNIRAERTITINTSP